MPRGPIKRSPNAVERRPNAVTVVIGIDPSATGTGLVALDLDGKLLSSTRLHYDEAGVRRLKAIEKGLCDWLVDGFPSPYRLGHIVIEGYAFDAGRGGSQSHKLGEVGGTIKLALFKVFGEPHGYPSIPVASQVKKYCLGTGKAKKEQMLKGVFKKWGADLDTNDEADAYTLAQIGRGLLGVTEPLGYENDVLKAMAKSPSTWAEMRPEDRYRFGTPAEYLRIASQ